MLRLSCNIWRMMASQSTTFYQVSRLGVGSVASAVICVLFHEDSYLNNEPSLRQQTTFLNQHWIWDWTSEEKITLMTAQFPGYARLVPKPETRTMESGMNIVIARLPALRLCNTAQNG